MLIHFLSRENKNGEDKIIVGTHAKENGNIAFNQRFLI